MKIVFLLPMLFLFSVVHAQDKKPSMRMYITPGMGSLSTEHTIMNDGVITSTTLTNKARLFFSPAIGLLKPLTNTLSLVADLGVNHKGYLVNTMQEYSNGSPGGHGYVREDYSFIETTLSLQKQLVLKNSSNGLLLGTGLFYGINDGYLGRLVWNPDVSSRNSIGNDVGFIFSGGLQKNHFLTALEWRQGLITLRNDKSRIFKTSIVGLKIGYVFSGNKKGDEIK